MLKLSRRIGESIVIGDNIFITVLGINGNQVSIGFDAPSSVIIHRHEIYQKINYEKQKIVFNSTKKYCPSMHQHH